MNDHTIVRYEGEPRPAGDSVDLSLLNQELREERAKTAAIRARRQAQPPPPVVEVAPKSALLMRSEQIQARILAALRACPQGLLIRAIAMRTGFTAGAVTYQLAQLCTVGAVTRVCVNRQPLKYRYQVVPDERT